VSVKQGANRPAAERRAKRLLVWLFVKTAGCALAVFVLIAIVAPILVDMRNDLALAGALLSVAAALTIAGWGAAEFYKDSRNIAEARRQSTLPPLKEHHHETLT